MTIVSPDGTVRAHFVYSPREPGRYHVFTDAAVWLGTVRRSADPIRKSHPWGWEAKTPMYPLGQKCDGGYRTRADAAAGMVELIATLR